MKSGKALLILLTVLLFVGPSVSAQACGDTNDDGTINITDLVMILEHIIGQPNPAFNVAAADCDGITGVTISDAERLTAFLYRGESLDCNVAGSYGFLPANDDTIFIPRLLDIPDGTDKVFLMIYARLATPASGVYLPLITPGSIGNSVFHFVRDWPSNIGLQGGSQLLPDTIATFGFDLIGNLPFSGLVNIAMLEYGRSSPGLGDIAPEATDRGGDWQIAVLRDGDLYRPIISYYDAALPSGVAVSMTPQNLYFTTAVDSIVTDTVIVGFEVLGPTGANIELDRSETWIILDDFDGSPPLPAYNSPAAVPISVDATGMGVGDYTGWVYVYYKGYDNWDNLIDSLQVTLSVTSDVILQFPPGDLNCDGTVDVGDLMYFVNYLFINGPAPEFCP